MRLWTPRTVPGNPKVGLAVASYLNEDPRRLKALLCLLQSFRAQTYQNWQCLVVHDGPCTTEWGELEQQLAVEKRITFEQMPVRRESFGHPYRQTAIDRLIHEGCIWIGLANDDCYYVPVYLEWLLSEAAEDGRFVYCDMVHSHFHWSTFITAPASCQIDVGGFLVHRDLAAKVTFDDFSHCGDGTYVTKLMEVNAAPVRKVPGVLYVHN